MNIGRLRTLIEGKSDSELVFFAMYDKHEADEYILNNEEDIKNRESKIIRLQKELLDLRNMIGKNKKEVKIDAVISIEN